MLRLCECRNQSIVLSDTVRAVDLTHLCGNGLKPLKLALVMQRSVTFLR